MGRKEWLRSIPKVDQFLDKGNDQKAGSTIWIRYRTGSGAFGIRKTACIFM